MDCLLIHHPPGENVSYKRMFPAKWSLSTQPNFSWFYKKDTSVYFIFLPGKHGILKTTLSNGDNFMNTAGGFMREVS